MFCFDWFQAAILTIWLVLSPALCILIPKGFWFNTQVTAMAPKADNKEKVPSRQWSCSELTDGQSKLLAVKRESLSPEELQKQIKESCLIDFGWWGILTKLLSETLIHIVGSRMDYLLSLSHPVQNQQGSCHYSGLRMPACIFEEGPPGLYQWALSM